MKHRYFWRLNVHVKPKKGDVYGGRLLSERSLQGLGKVGNTWYILQSLNGAIGLDGWNWTFTIQTQISLIPEGIPVVPDFTIDVRLENSQVYSLHQYLDEIDLSKIKVDQWSVVLYPKSQIQ